MLTNRYNDLDTCLSDYTEWYTYQQTLITKHEECIRFLKLAIDGRLFILHLLRDAIMALRDRYTNDTELDTALNAFTNWYVTNSDTISDVMPMLMFLKKATDDSLHLLHMMRDVVMNARAEAAADALIWLPKHG